MPEMTYSCEIEPDKLTDVNGPVPQRLTIADISLFMDGGDWLLARIREAFSWTDFDPRDEYWSRLVIVSPETSINAYRTANYFRKWRQWPWQESSTDHRINLLHQHHGLRREHIVDIGDIPDPSCTVTVPFFPKEYFDQFHTDTSHLTDQDWSSGNWPDELTPAHAWLELFETVLGHIDTDKWYGPEGFKVDTPLANRLGDGDIRIPTSLDYDGRNEIREIYLLQPGDNGTIGARAFVLPEAFDPVGHLP
jgi:hypothetical protein